MAKGLGKHDTALYLGGSGALNDLSSLIVSSILTKLAPATYET